MLEIIISTLGSGPNSTSIWKTINLNSKLFTIWLLACVDLVQMKANITDSSYESSLKHNLSNQGVNVLYLGYFYELLY